jgi:hypothetical protein
MLLSFVMRSLTQLEHSSSHQFLERVTIVRTQLSDVVRVFEFVPFQRQFYPVESIYLNISATFFGHLIFIYNGS